MLRRIRALVVLAVAAAAIPASAQTFPTNVFSYLFDNGGRPMGQPEFPVQAPDWKTGVWVATWQRNPMYLLTVRLHVEQFRYGLTAAVGQGEAHLFNPHGEDLRFRYRCDRVFPTGSPAEFEARWVKPGRQLEILLRQVGTDHTGTCRLTTSAL